MAFNTNKARVARFAITIPLFLILGISSVQAVTNLTIHCSLSRYDFALGQTGLIPVFFDRRPDISLFSYGIQLNISGTTPVASNVVDVILPSSLSHNGVRTNDVIRTFTLGGAAAKGTVDFFASLQPVYKQPILATFVLSNLPVGTYVLQPSLYKTLGSNEAVFVIGAGTVSDSLISFSPAIVNVLGDWEEIAPAYVRSDDSNIFITTYRLHNTSAVTWNKVRITVQNLPGGVILNNRRGITDGNPFIQYDIPLAAGQFVDLKLKYYIPKGRTMPNPTFRVEPTAQSSPALALTPSILSNAVVLSPPMVVGPVRLEDGSRMIGFPSVDGATYFIQYADAVAGPWNTAFPPLTGTGNFIQWVDGPTKTDSDPVDSVQRYYRVLIMAP